MAKNETQPNLYVGLDLGGTKIQASLVTEPGKILGSQRTATPREGTPDDILEAMQAAVSKVLDKHDLAVDELTGLGIAVPGVVDVKKGRVVVTPNINFSDVAVRGPLEEALDVPVALGNDCNLGTLGEAWLGAARGAKTAVGIFWGTGIGGGFVYQNGKIWRGYRQSALEIGHLVMQIDGPVCGCGNRGCFEALAGRLAIERQIRERVAAGESTVLTEILEGDLSRIRSGALKQALKKDDPLVTGILRQAARVVGNACLTLRHILDPQVIVLGGGVMEACGGFLLPIVEEIVAADALAGSREGGQVVGSELGDDAVVLGAVALARMRVKRSPF